MNNFVLRSITGVCLAGIIAGAIVSGFYGFLLLLFLINLLALSEFYRLFHSADIRSDTFMGILLSITLSVTLILVFLQMAGWRIILINIPLITGIFLFELFKRAAHPFQNIAITFLGIIYITFPLILFSFIAFLPFTFITYHSHIMLGYFFMLWANDSGAYASGKIFGKHQLFKRISPGKTWEGSIGGAISALLTAFFISCFYTEMQTGNWLDTALIIIVTGTFGDLTKSMMKRSLNVKDSGNILPGHGGMLDRFDSLLGSAPFVFSFFALFD